MTPLIFIALATLVGLPPHTARLAPASATKTTAKTPRDGPTERGGLISKLKPAAPLDPLAVAGDVELSQRAWPQGSPRTAPPPRWPAPRMPRLRSCGRPSPRYSGWVFPRSPRGAT